MATAFAPADAEWLAALVKRHAFNSRNNCWHPCITEWVEKRMDELCAASPPLSQADVFERIIRDAPGKRGNQLTFLGEDRAAVDEAIARCTADCKTDFKWARVNFDGRDKFGVLVSPPGPIVIDDTYEGHWQHEWCKQNADFIAACGRNLFPRMERQIMDARNAGVPSRLLSARWWTGAARSRRLLCWRDDRDAPLRGARPRRRRGAHPGRLILLREQ